MVFARPRLKLLLLVCHVLNVEGVTFNDNLHIDNGDGFLVNSMLPTPSGSQAIETQQFYIYNQNTATKITSTFGNLKAEQNITYKLNDYSTADPLSLKVINVDGGANITAHLVQSTVTNSKPNLRVLVHSDRELARDRCARVYAKREEKETVSEYCILGSGTASSKNAGSAVVCMVTVPLPYIWWLAREIEVYYDIVDTSICHTVSNDIVSPVLPDSAFFIGEVVLMFDDRHGSKEITEDMNVGLTIPARPQQAGSSFSIIINLHPGSALQLFTIRVELGDGLMLKNVESADSTRWTVRMRRVGSSSAVDIEAYLQTGAEPSAKIQEVIKCDLQVARSMVQLEANIRWTVQYLMEDPKSDLHQRTITTKIRVEKADQVTDLVAVLKTHELVSLRRFTSSVTAIPVWLYAIDRSDNILQVNAASRCYSLGSSILEVSKLCDMIYLSGEGSDPRIVEVALEYASIKLTVDVRVWYPDVQMFIKLSDDRLSEVKWWKVKKETNEVDMHVECKLQYQVSDVKVYTKFYTVHERKDVYMRGGKVEVFADITSHVTHLIQTANRDVAIFEGGTLRGVSPGKTKVKVVSAQGSTLASADVRVSTSKTQIDRISANFVSHMDMMISGSSEEGLLSVQYNYEKLLTDKSSEGMLELWVHFTDGKVVPLSIFDRHSYKLVIDNKTPSILALPSDDYKNRYITVRAVGRGNGVLELTLYMAPVCQKKTKKLSVGYAYIDSQFSKPAGDFVNDETYKSGPVKDAPFGGSKHGYPHKPMIKDKPAGQEKQLPVITNSQPVRINSHMDSNRGLSPLQTGMFVLMGVLGVVASVFVTNCLVYAYRQHQLKAAGGVVKSGTDGSEKVDSGWVWLNRSTLEENAINTSPEPLLSQKDFDKRCSRSDSLQSTRSKRSSTGTYQGSECSIRIRVNPAHTLNLPDSDSDSEEELYSADIQPVIGIEEPELSDLSDIYSLSSLESVNRRMQLQGGCDECQRSFIVESEEELPASPTNLTQEQFDNLRESRA